VRLLAVQAGRQGFVGVRAGVVFDAQLLACLAAPAFADDGQGGLRGRFFQQLDTGLEMHGMGQALLQGRDVHDPGQRLGALLGGRKMQRATMITMHLHRGHWRDRGSQLGIVSGVQPPVAGPGTHRLQQSAGIAVDGVGPDIRCAWCRARWCDQGHLQTVARQQEGQGLANDAGATHDDVGPAATAGAGRTGVHGGILGAGHNRAA